MLTKICTLFSTCNITHSILFYTLLSPIIIYTLLAYESLYTDIAIRTVFLHNLQNKIEY